MTRTPAHDVLTLPEVAEWLGMHPNSVHRAARSGRLPARRVGREWRFLREAVAARRGSGGRLHRGSDESPGPERASVPEAPVEVSAREAALFLRVDVKTVWIEASSARLPAWKEGGEWRTTERALREYLASDPESDQRYAKPRSKAPPAEE